MVFACGDVFALVVSLTLYLATLVDLMVGMDGRLVSLPTRFTTTFLWISLKNLPFTEWQAVNAGEIIMWSCVPWVGY